MHKGSEPPRIPKLVGIADVLRLLGFGWYFATSLGAGAVGGYFLDRWLGTKPWLLIAGMLLGTVLGFYGMFKMLMPVYKAKGGNVPKAKDGNTSTRGDGE